MVAEMSKQHIPHSKGIDMIPTVFRILMFLVLSGSAETRQGIGQVPVPSAQDRRDPAELVVLPAVAVSPDGTYIMDLRQDDFQVLEGGQLQNIVAFSQPHEPTRVTLVFDVSSSYLDFLEQMKTEAIRFVKLLPANAAIGIATFALSIRTRQEHTLDRTQIITSILRIEGWMGMESTKSAVYDTVGGLLDRVLDHADQRNVIVLFTDGADNGSKKYSQKQTLEIAKRTRGIVYNIYPNPFSRPDFGRTYRRMLAEYTGGVAFSANTLPKLEATLAQIAKEIAGRYEIGYFPSNQKRDGKFRKVEVRLKNPDLKIRTKTGYYAFTAGK